MSRFPLLTPETMDPKQLEVAEKIVSGSQRLSQHETIMTSGVWP